MSEANRGKKAEGKVAAYLKKLSLEVAEFDFERVLDARAAGGRFPSRTGDFSWWLPGRHGVIEVKETEHASRLPYKNTSEQSAAKLFKRQLAGGEIAVLVYHSMTGLWRVLPLAWLQQKDASTPSGSFDLSQEPSDQSLPAVLDPFFRS